MRFRDLLLAKAVADIHRHVVRKRLQLVPLWSIQPMHGLDRDTALARLKERVELLKQHKQAIVRKRNLTRRNLLDFLPSISGIKAIEDGNGGYISFEGNGRVAACKQVFTDSDKLRLEVEVYTVDDPRKILRRVRRVQQRNFGFKSGR